MRTLIVLLALLSFTGAHAGSLAEVKSLLAREAPPDGVVFEILADDDGLTWAIPQVRGYVERLRGRFPGLDIAVVSHGKEQFALKSSERKEYAEVHRQVESLVGEQVPLHVCGTHASWYGVNPEDFPPYVDVATTGPAQINDYVRLGYELIVVERDGPEAKE